MKSFVLNIKSIFSNRKLLLSLISALLLIIFITSVSIAFFSSLLDGVDSNSNIVIARVGSVEYTTESPQEEGILPGWVGEGSTKVYLISDSSIPIDYTCTIEFIDDKNNIYVQTTNCEDGKVLL